MGWIHGVWINTKVPAVAGSDHSRLVSFRSRTKFKNPTSDSCFRWTLHYGWLLSDGTFKALTFKIRTEMSNELRSMDGWPGQCWQERETVEPVQTDFPVLWAGSVITVAGPAHHHVSSTQSRHSASINVYPIHLPNKRPNENWILVICI